MNLQEAFRGISQRVIGLSEGKKPPFPAYTDMDWGGLDEQPLDQEHLKRFNPRQRMVDFLTNDRTTTVAGIGTFVVGSVALSRILGFNDNYVLQLVSSLFLHPFK